MFINRLLIMNLMFIANWRLAMNLKLYSHGENQGNPQNPFIFNMLSFYI